MESTQIHFLAFCVLVNATCMIISWLSQWCERSLCSVSQMVLGDKVKCVVSTSHHYDIITGLYCTVHLFMSDCKRPRLGRRAVHRNQFGRVWKILSRISYRSSDEENSVFCCRTAVVLPPHCCVLQMLSRSFSVNLAGVSQAGNQVVGDKVHCWVFGQLPWVVLKHAALLCWRPEFDRVRCS